MSGAFYGSLAASASVFAAILTALMVNNYVQIKGDRRQVQHRLVRLDGELDGLKEQRDKHQSTVEEIRSDWEQEYREKAEDVVEDFIDEHVGSEFTKPIEKLTLNYLYQELIEYTEAENAADLKGSAQEPHHKDVLEERMDEIEEAIVENLTHYFAKRYKGRGWEPEESRRSLADRLDNYEVSDDKKEFLESETEPLQLEEFIEKYKDKHDLNSLNSKTQEALRRKYERLVDADVDSNPLGASGSLFPGISQGVTSAFEEIQHEPTFENFASIPSNPAAAQMRSVSEQEEYRKARDKVMQLNANIEALKQEKEALESQLERLHPEDLKDALFANVVTIILSVVFPITAYLATLAGFTVGDHDWPGYTDLAVVFLFWLLGLVVVFEWIHAEINDVEPRTYRAYRRTWSGLSWLW